MRKTSTILLALAIMQVAFAPQNRSPKTLDIYVLDADGGKATLFVSPSGESLLLDSGSPGGRDTDRIMAAIAEAGLKQIDYVLSSHYHVDHVGGLQELASRIPIRHYVDHGPTVEEREQVPGFQQAYAELYKRASHIVVKPGDTIPIAGLDWRIVTSAGHAIRTPLPGGGQPNPYCADFKPRENLHDPENGQSVGSVVSYGKFRAVDLADLLWNDEFDLMCPNNRIGRVDVYLVSHHGTDPSGSTTLVHALAPRVAIMQNGPRKGGTVQTLQTLHSSPGLEDIWQLHWSHNAGVEQNPSGLFIANVEDLQTIATILTSASDGRQVGGAHTGPAYWIKVSAQPDGTFTVTNTRNGFSKTYRAR